MVAASGEGARPTMTAGINLAFELLNADHGIEAARLISKLSSTRKQVHGPDYGLTHDIASNLQICKVRCAALKYQNESKSFQAL